MKKGSFLNYYKTILEKVSFDVHLLEKEYKKAQSILDGSESKELDYWLITSGLEHKIKGYPLHNRKTDRVVD
ncbi:hypothetical protein [Algoriphagus winogradskyi]|uniref:Uncharacterized protein n=1 Tax=Algoriphagus winogradskyi TaxID=237017 RepID=A0ABY1P4A8_9BACT|nr:hypothetical protein [Algoriphagus winogradskyi]SMP26020.1 hypothetical protein SAMN06265367_104282 [Algoriphagus winogradskyi]